MFNRTKHLGTRRVGSHFDLLEDEITDTVEDQEDFVWMPHQMWNIELLCAHCTSPRRSLSSKGVYNHVRLIMDVKDYYYTAAECMYCASSLGIAGLSTNCLKTISDYFQLSLPISMAATRPSCP